MPILKEEEVIVFRGYPSVLRKMPQLKKNLTQKFQTIYRLLAVKKENPASSAAEQKTGISSAKQFSSFDLTYLLYRMYFK